MYKGQDEPDAPEGGEVLGRRRAGDVEDRRDLADAELVSFERGEDPQPRAVREDLRGCLLYTSVAADERDSVDLGGSRDIKKKKKK